MPDCLLRWWPVLLPLAVYVAHGLALGTWIVDDAGISFSYAINLADGHGLVAQVGDPPVEGYSNPTWVLLIAALRAIGAFHEVWTPKVLSTILVASTMTVLFAVSARRAAARAPITVALTLLATQPAFVIWSVSGLENPLYVLLVVVLCAACATARPTSAGHAGGIALLAAAVALTRPEGIIFAVGFPLSLWWTAAARRAWLRPLAIYMLVFALVIGASEVFRVCYFGEWLPNTYYAKGTRTGGKLIGGLGRVALVVALVAVERRLVRRGVWRGAAVILAVLVVNAGLFELAGMTKLVASIGGVAGSALCAAVATALVWQPPRTISTWERALALFSLLAALAFFALPRDWMSEWRFASPFFPLIYALAACVAGRFMSFGSWRVSIIPVVVIAVLLTDALPRIVKFRRDPTASLQTVSEFAALINGFADTLEVGQGSILSPDAGGMLLHCRLRHIDLGGLCDRTIARTIGSDRAAFLNYVLGDKKPTLISLHGSWAAQARLGSDPRFARDYAVIRDWSAVGPEAGVVSGIFVRRAVVRDWTILQRLR